MGVKVVLVRSFARIHETNLKKQGMLALTFTNRNDYDKIREDDIELHKFGIQWLRFILFGEETIAIKKDVLEAKKKELAQKQADKKNG